MPACKEQALRLGVVTNLLHFDWSFDLRYILLNVSLQRRDVNRLANGPCHLRDYRMYRIPEKERGKKRLQARLPFTTFLARELPKSLLASLGTSVIDADGRQASANSANS